MVQTMPSGTHSHPEGRLHGPWVACVPALEGEGVSGAKRRASEGVHRRFLRSSESPTNRQLIANSFLQDIGRTASLADLLKNAKIE